MDTMTTAQWHETDEFWDHLGPILFEAGRWETAPSEIDSVLSLLGAPAGSPLLDLCCGPGRHALELARRGFRVTGVDRTASFLDMARNAADGLPAEFVQDDMRNFCRPEAYTGIINLYSSFGYFEDPADDRSALENMWHSLQPGGTLVMEMLGKEILARHLPGRNWVEWENGFLLEATQITQDLSWLENRWITITEDGVNEFFWGHRLYSAPELSALLTDVGFTDTRIYGSLSATPYNHSASRLVAVACRPE
jgi:SAM-dependent methyltransferase